MEEFKQFATTNASSKAPSTRNRERYWWISTEGRVKCTDNYSDKIKWPKISPTGGKEGSRYAAISLNIGGKYIHKIVANAFLGEKPSSDEKWVVDHIDENRMNNNIDNLQWLTNSNNLQKYWDARKAATLPINNNYQELYEDLLNTLPRQDRSDEIITLYKAGLSGTDIIEHLDLSHNVVYFAIGKYRRQNKLTKYNK